MNIRIPPYSHCLVILLICTIIDPLYGYSCKELKICKPFPPERKVKKVRRRDSIKVKNPVIDWNMDGSFEGVFIPEGAIKDGVAYDQLLHADAIIHTKPLGFWSGGRLFVSAVQISSGQPSVNDIGDLQVASNISARPAFRIYEFSYTQNFSHKFVISAGLIDMNKFFAKANQASDLLNSSFGIEPDISANVPVSIFPKPGLGISVAKYFTHWKVQGSLFQNDPSDRSDISARRYMAIFEVDYHTDRGLAGYPAVYKLGLWHHSAFSSSPGEKPHAHNGYYFIAQQTIINTTLRKTALFLQWGSSPMHISTIPYYLGLGVQVDHPFPSRPLDQFSAGMAKAWTNMSLSDAETAFELTYQLQADRYISVQPDFQYIRHPDGLLQKNALVVFLRAVVTIR